MALTVDRVERRLVVTDTETGRRMVVEPAHIPHWQAISEGSQVEVFQQVAKRNGRKFNLTHLLQSNGTQVRWRVAVILQAFDEQPVVWNQLIPMAGVNNVLDRLADVLERKWQKAETDEYDDVVQAFLDARE